MKPTPKFERGTPEHREFLREAGRLGGLANLATNGHEHFSKIGTKGAKGLMKKFKTEEEAKRYFSRIGSLGKGQGRKRKGAAADE